MLYFSAYIDFFRPLFSRIQQVSLGDEDSKACERTVCPSNCNGRGRCIKHEQLAYEASKTYSEPWDALKHVGCVKLGSLLTKLADFLKIEEEFTPGAVIECHIECVRALKGIVHLHN